MMGQMHDFNPKITKIQNVLGDSVPRFRLDQVAEAIYKKHISKFSDISTLPIFSREKLEETVGDTLSLTVARESIGQQSHKVLFSTKEGDQKIEAVRMTYLPNANRKHVHYSLCVSSQSGCALGCTFCATGAVGFKKNLTAEEITDQVLYFLQKGLPIDSIVFMGMGEPFSNPHLFDALKILTHEDFFAMSPRRISVSTVGIIPGIERLIKEYPQMNLAFSLHSPFNEERLSIMPVNQSYPIESVMQTINKYVVETNNRVFIAYILLKGVNDSPKHAEALAELIKGQGSKSYLSHVNLIRFHPGSTLETYQKPEDSSVNKFMSILTNHGVKNTLRQSFGLDIDGACGQLYGEYESKNKKVID